MAEQTSSTGDEDKAIDVIRDSTFTRFVADEGVIFDMGRDLEVGFLQYGPMILRQVAVDNAERTDLQNIVTEVARLRIRKSEFLKIAMSFIHDEITGGRLRGNVIVKSIVEWTEIAKTATSLDSDEE